MEAELRSTIEEFKADQKAFNSMVIQSETKIAQDEWHLEFLGGVFSLTLSIGALLFSTGLALALWCFPHP
jgi:hypothetical protein